MKTTEQIPALNKSNIPFNRAKVTNNYIQFFMILKYTLASW